MNITEFMSFDLEWFTTLPGILITSGVVVLLIALIVFIVTNKKDKEEIISRTAEQAILNNQTNQDMSSQASQSNDMVNLNAMYNNVNQAQDIQPEAVVNTDIPMVAPISQEQPYVINEQPVVNNVPAVEVGQVQGLEATPMPAVQPASVVEPVPAVVSMPTEIPTPEPMVESKVSFDGAQSTVDFVANNPVPERHTAYGGVEPASTISREELNRPVIYGGANPLENTNTIPTLVNHEAYNASSNIGYQAMPRQTMENSFSEQQVNSVNIPTYEIPVTEINAVNQMEPIAVNDESSLTAASEPVATFENAAAQEAVPVTTGAPTDEIETLEF